MSGSDEVLSVADTVNLEAELLNTHLFDHFIRGIRKLVTVGDAETVIDGLFERFELGEVPLESEFKDAASPWNQKLVCAVALRSRYYSSMQPEVRDEVDRYLFQTFLETDSLDLFENLHEVFKSATDDLNEYVFDHLWKIATGELERYWVERPGRLLSLDRTCLETLIEGPYDLDQAEIVELLEHWSSEESRRVLHSRIELASRLFDIGDPSWLQGMIDELLVEVDQPTTIRRKVEAALDVVRIADLLDVEVPEIVADCITRELSDHLTPGRRKSVDLYSVVLACSHLPDQALSKAATAMLELSGQKPKTYTVLNSPPQRGSTVKRLRMS